VLDTYPLKSLPLPLDEGMLVPVLNAADALLGPAPPAEISTSLTVDTMLVQGLNKRLGTNCSTLACTIVATNANAAAGKAPGSVLEATAIPEKDSWRCEWATAGMPRPPGPPSPQHTHTHDPLTPLLHSFTPSRRCKQRVLRVLRVCGDGLEGGAAVAAAAL